MCDHCGCRAYPPIAELTAEHEAILSLAARVADATHAHVPVDAALRDELLALLAVHGAKEEAGLYPFLIEAAGKAADAFEELEEEHRELRAAIEQDRFDHLAHYALQRHIEEEEEVLFSAATFHFDGDMWDELDRVHSNARVAPGPPEAKGACHDGRTRPRDDYRDLDRRRQLPVVPPGDDRRPAG